MFIVIVYVPVCDVINFEINLSFLIKQFSNITKKVMTKNVKILRMKRAFKKHYSSFLKDLH